MIADDAVVRDVHVGHDPVVVADARAPRSCAGAAVDRDELADQTLRSPMIESCGSPPYFLSCGISPIDANWKMRLSRADASSAL